MDLDEYKSRFPLHHDFLFHFQKKNADEYFIYAIKSILTVMRRQREKVCGGLTKREK